MAEKKTYLIVQSVLCVLLCVLLAASAVSIYREGAARRAEDPMASIYTREKTAEKFKPIAPLFFGAIGMTVAGWILAVKDENADKPVMDAEIVRNLTVSRVKTPSEAMLEEQKKQKQLALTGWGLFALCMVPIAIYVLNGKHFPDGNLEEMIAALAIHVFPWIILGLGCLCISTILQEKSIQRETAAAQEQLKAEKVKAYMIYDVRGDKFNPDYELSAENVGGYWLNLIGFALIFAAFATVTLEFIDKDKR